MATAPPRTLLVATPRDSTPSPVISSITNGVGSDLTAIIDTNVGGNVTVNNGKGNASVDTAGSTQFYNSALNPSVRAVIGGNVSVSDLTGNVVGTQGIWDTEVRGNVTFANGPCPRTTNFDGKATNLPVIILGSLTITGSGAHTVNVGTDAGAGMTVGGKLSRLPFPRRRG